MSLSVSFNQLYKWLERNHNHRNVVQWVGPCSRMQHLIHCVPNYLMNTLRLIWYVHGNSAPYDIVHLVCWQLVKDAIWAREYVVKLLATILLIIEVWCADYYVGVATELMVLGLQVAEGPAHGESSRKDTIGPNQRIVHRVLFLWRLIYSYLLQARLALGVYHRMRLVNVSSRRFNPSELRKLSRLVVFTKVYSNLSVALAPYSSAVANVNDIQVVIEGHHHVGTWARLAILKLLCCFVLHSKHGWGCEVPPP